jgi:S-adenosylmethionine hydrolase
VELERIDVPPSVRTGRSSTFHGRDVFAPAAAALVLGRSLGSLGGEVVDPVRLAEPPSVRDDALGTGSVVAVDRFGNLLTNLPGAWLVEGAVRVPGKTLRSVSTYGEAGPGEIVALVGSDGRVELAVRDGSAAEALSAAPGSPVQVVFGRRQE